MMKLFCIGGKPFKVIYAFGFLLVALCVQQGLAGTVLSRSKRDIITGLIH